MSLPILHKQHTSMFMRALKLTRLLLHYAYLALGVELYLWGRLEKMAVARTLHSPVTNKLPRIAFFTIVLNGEPWLKMNIEHLYKHAAQIFIIEGATRADGVRHYWDGDSSHHCTVDGHSIDRTLEICAELKEKDTENKITIITTNGYWNGKTKMCNSFLHLVNADYLWQVDVDEFYHDRDIERLIDYLQLNPTLTSVSFYAKYFFASLNSIVAGQYGNGPHEWLRIFKYHGGYTWFKHEPPRYGDPISGKTVDTINPLTKDRAREMGIYMYHYSYVLEDQVSFKETFFGTPGLMAYVKQIRAQLLRGRGAIEVDHPKFAAFGDMWVVPFEGTHPPPIQQNFALLSKLELTAPEE